MKVRNIIILIILIIVVAFIIIRPGVRNMRIDQDIENIKVSKSYVLEDKGIIAKPNDNFYLEIVDKEVLKEIKDIINSSDKARITRNVDSDYDLLINLGEDNNRLLQFRLANGHGSFVYQGEANVEYRISNEDMNRIKEIFLE